MNPHVSIFQLVLILIPFAICVPSTSTSYNPNVPLTDPFVLLKNISQQVVQPEEFIKLSMDEFFRGQFLAYRYQVVTDEFANYTDDLLTQQLGVIQTKDVPFDTENSQLGAQIDATMVYQDVNSNLYFAFVDQDLFLNLYFIEAYYTADDNQIPSPWMYDLYNETEMSYLKRCSHLVRLNQTAFLVNCLANRAGPSYDYGVFVYMVFDPDDKVNHRMSISYVQNEYDYEALEQGSLIAYTYTNFSTETNEQFFVMKFYDSNSFVMILSSNFTPLYNLSYIVTPYYNDDYPQINHTQMVIQEVMQLSTIPYLVISDYSYGIFIINLPCDNVTCYFNEEVHYINYPKFNAITQTETKDPNAFIIFGLVPSPPQVVEIMYNFNSAYVQNQYIIDQDDDNFLALEKISANYNFILVSMVAADSYMPQVRVYARDTGSFGFGHYWFAYPEIGYKSSFMSFMSLSENSFITKTSNTFRIYNCLAQEVAINATNYTFLEEIGIIGETIDVNLTVKNYSLSELSTIFSIVYLTQNASETIATTNYYVTGDKEVEFDFACGNRVIEFDITDLFNGPQLSLKLQALPEEPYYTQDLFYLSLPYIEYLPQSSLDVEIDNPVPIPITGCELNSFLNFTIDGRVMIYFTCIQLFDEHIHFIDMYNLTRDQDSYILNYTIPYAKIVSYIADQPNADFYVFSAQSADQHQSLIMHYFKIYNILAWENKQDLYIEYPELGLFQFEIDLRIQVKYKNSLQQGILPSKAVEMTDDEGNTYYQSMLVIFEFVSNSGIKELNVRAILKLNLTSEYSIQNCKLDDYGLLWLLFNNNTLYNYAQEPTYPYLEVTTGYNYSYFLKRANVLDFTEDAKLWNFHIGETDLILFVGNNTMELMELFDQSPFNLIKIMDMPLSFNDSTKFENSSDPLQENYFFIDGVSIKPVYSSSDDYLVVLYEQRQGDEFAFNFLNVYDLSKTRNNILMAQYEIPYNFTINPNYSYIYFLEISDVQVVAITTNNSMLLLGSYLDTLLVSNLSSPGWDDLNFYCRSTPADLQYIIYPAEDITQNVSIKLSGINNGNLIQVGYLEDTMTLMSQSFDSNFYLPFNGSYSLNENNNGYGLQFSIKCLEDDTDNAASCNYSSISPSYENVQQSIAFLNSYDYLIGFFFVEPVFIMVDLSDRLTIFEIQANSYTQFIASEILGVNPDLYVKELDYQDRLGTTGNVTYMAYQSVDLLQFGITKIYSSQFKTPDNSNGQYVTYSTTSSSTIYIKQITSQYRMTQSLSEIVNLNREMNEDELVLIIKYDVDSSFPESYIEFYYVSFNDSSSVNISCKQSATLTTINLNIFQFQVTTMAIYPMSTLLVLAIRSYGLLIYDVATFRTVQYVSLIEQAQYEEFIISSILTSESSSLYLVFEAFGTLRVTLLLNDTCELNCTIGYAIQNYFGLFEEGERAIKGQSVQFGPGYAYLTLVQENDIISAVSYKNSFNIRFIYTFLMNNSKEIGFNQIVSDYACQMIESLPYYYGTYIFGTSSQITSSYQIIAAVCHSELIYTVMNLEPSIQVNLEDIDSMMFSETVLINISNSQDYKEMYLTVNSMIDELPTNAAELGYFAVLILIIIIMFVFVYSSSKAHIKAKEKIEKQKIEDPILMTLQQEAPSAIPRPSIDFIKVRLESHRKHLEDQYLSTQENEQEKDSFIQSRRITQLSGI